MARITTEDCLDYVPNMYELVHVATKRARQIFKGSDVTVRSKNRVIVTALREVAAGNIVSFRESVEQAANESDDLALPQ
jgi:DNA-directed RNA polymerase subunit omega